MLRIQVIAVGVVGSLLSTFLYAADAPPPIRTVEIKNRVLYVNDKPFLPIMCWLQDAENFASLRDCGMNTVAGYWPASSGTKDVTEFLPKVQQADLYGVMPYHEGLKGHAALLGYLHMDEPDLPHQVNDAEVKPVSELRINRSTPLWKIVDGVTHSWSVLDPLEKATIAIRSPQPVRVSSLGIWLTVSRGLAIAKDVEFYGDGKLLAKATLETKRGRQVIPLDEPATFQELRMTVLSTYPGEQVWGSISEIEGFDDQGHSLLVSPPRNEPRAWPDEVAKSYQEIRAADPTRPVFMTLTGNFHPHFDKWNEQQRASLYPAYIRLADVVGYDIYPIYGWNKPEWIHLVHEATEMLVAHAGPRPVYAWIETSKGGQYTGDLSRQKDVAPAHIRAEVWMAICRGATAIGYFTHVWKPKYQQFGVPPENRKALRQINAQLTRLAPVLLTGRPFPADIESGDVKVDLMTRRFDDGQYIFLVNYDEQYRPAEIRVKIEGLAANTAIAVVDEDRQLVSEVGGFSDRLDPLGVRIYRLAPVP